MQDMCRRPTYAVVLIGLLAAVMSIFLAIQATPLAMATSTNTLTANVNVPGVCWANALPNPLSFGSVSPGTTYSTSLQATDNDVGGNMASYLWVMGSSWAYLSNTIGVGNTLWNPTTSGSYTGTALTGTSANTLIFMPAPSITTPTTSNYIYFGMNVPAGAANGVYTQTITFNNLCAGTGSISNAIALTANVLVPAVCYTSLGPNAVTFGTMYPGTTYNTNVVITDNDVGGNAQATMYVEGNANWLYGTNAIGVSNTLWNPSSLSSYAGNALTSGFLTTGIVISAPSMATPTTSANVYFGMNVPGGTTAGLYTQTITIENSC